MRIGSNNYYQQCPSNNSEIVVRVSFSKAKKEVSAQVQIGERVVKIKREYLPKELKQIQSLELFKKFFAEAFVTVRKCTNGDYSFSVNQRGRGGMYQEAEDTVSLIQEGITEGNAHIAPHLAAMRPELVMVVGSIGMGKSSLCNAMYGFPVNGVPGRNGTFRFDTPPGEAGVFPISHNPNVPGTRYPDIRSPQEIAYSLCDTPGLGEVDLTFSRNIVNSFLRSRILNNADSFRILLVVSYNEISGRGLNFEQTLADLIQFLDCAANVGRVAPGISLAVTKVPRGTNRLQVERFLNAKTANDSPLPDNQKEVLRLILEHNRWNIFSSPNGPGVNHQAPAEGLAIREMVENSEQIQRQHGMNPSPQVPQREENIVLILLSGFTNNVLGRLRRDLPHLMDAHIRGLYRRDDAEIQFIQLRNLLQNFLVTQQVGTLLEMANAFHAIVPLPNDLLTYITNHQGFAQYMHALLRPAIAPLDRIRKNWIADVDSPHIADIRGEIQNRINGLNTMLAPPTIDAQPEGRLIVRGFFPKISHLNERLRAKSLDVSQQTFAFFGLHSMTFDEDLVSSKFAGKNVIVIAPKWRIMNHRNIVLNGNDCTTAFTKPADDGKPRAVNPPIKIERIGTVGKTKKDFNSHIPHDDIVYSKTTVVRAQFNTVPGEGKAGSPGDPGGSGGHFRGYGETFSGLERLWIKSIGGTGGGGQGGGGGCDGLDAPDAPNEMRPSHQGVVWDVVYNKDGNGNQYHRNEEVPAQVGGVGGLGGSGGVGGYKGTVVIATPRSHNIYSPASGALKQGNPGLHGKAGPGGRGGVNGRAWGGSWNWKSRDWNGNKADHPQYLTEKRRTASGKAGDKSLVNISGIKNPDPTPEINYERYIAIFKDYAPRFNNTWSNGAPQAFIQQF